MPVILRPIQLLLHTTSFIPWMCSIQNLIDIPHVLRARGVQRGIRAVGRELTRAGLVAIGKRTIVGA